MSGWTKLFSSIVTSSVWCEDHTTVRVWVAMLAMADHDGLVEGTIPGFASLARVTRKEMEEAVKRLSAPDKDSRTDTENGRRIEPIEGGWRIINYSIYRERPQEKEGSKAPAMRRYRARKRVTEGNGLPPVVTRSAPRVTREPEARSKKRDNRERTTDLRTAAPPADKPAAERPWNDVACEAVTARYKGTAPGGRITKALRPLVKQHGEAVVLDAWNRYLAETEAEYMSPERFATTFSHYRAQGHALPEVPVVAEVPRPPPDPAAETLWQRALAVIQPRISKQGFATWFRPTVGYVVQGEVLVVRVASAQAVEWIPANYRAPLSAGVAAIADAGVKSVTFSPWAAPP
jgi:hypothetical protein